MRAWMKIPAENFLGYASTWLGVNLIPYKTGLSMRPHSNPTKIWPQLKRLHFLDSHKRQYLQKFWKILEDRNFSPVTQRVRQLTTQNVSATTKKPFFLFFCVIPISRTMRDTQAGKFIAEILKIKMEINRQY